MVLAQDFSHLQPCLMLASLGSAPFFSRGTYWPHPKHHPPTNPMGLALVTTPKDLFPLCLVSACLEHTCSLARPPQLGSVGLAQSLHPHSHPIGSTSCRDLLRISVPQTCQAPATPTVLINVPHKHTHNSNPSLLDHTPSLHCSSSLGLRPPSPHSHLYPFS